MVKKTKSLFNDLNLEANIAEILREYLVSLGESNAYAYVTYRLEHDFLTKTFTVAVRDVRNPNLRGKWLVDVEFESNNKCAVSISYIETHISRMVGGRTIHDTSVVFKKQKNYSY